jgi:hypothetical protein
MAKLGAFINTTAIRGKLGGQVFTAGRSGATLRTRVKGKNPRSVTQSSRRANLAVAARAAKALSSANVTNWKTYVAGITKHNAVSGAAYHPSWFNAYVGLYADLLLATPGAAAPTTSPSTAYTGDTITITAAGTSGTITYTGSAQQTAGSKTMFLAQKLAAPNRTPGAKKYTILGTSAVPTTPFQVAFSSLPAGTYAVGYKFVNTTTGQTSLPVFLTNVIVT